MKMLGRNLCSAWKQHRLLLNRLIGNWDSVTFNPYESYIKGLIIGACSCVPFCMYTSPLFYFILFIYLLFILFRVCLIQPYSTNLLYHHIQLIQRHSTRLWTTYNMTRSPQEIQSSTSLPPYTSWHLSRYLMTSSSLPHDILSDINCPPRVLCTYNLVMKCKRAPNTEPPSASPAGPHTIRRHTRCPQEAVMKCLRVTSGLAQARIYFFLKVQQRLKDHCHWI